MSAFPKYDSYQNTGVEWLGNIPAHWELSSIRAVTELKSEKNRPELQVLSVYREYGVITKDSREDNHNATSLDTTTYKVVKPGDLVVNKMKAWQGSMGVSEYEGIVSPAYITCKTNSDKISPRFLHYLLRSRPYIGVYNALSYGVRIGQWDMHYEDFKKIELPLAPKSEQERIVNFLDQKTAEIDAAIVKKQRLIELLKEQKAILTNQAVTKGLNPNVPMRDSGVDGVGQIPAHWEALFNRRLFRETTRKLTDANEVSLSLSQVDGLILSSEMKERSLRPSQFDNFKVCLPDDLVINRFKGHLGVFFAATLRGMVTFHYGVFKPLRDISTKYFELLYHTEAYKTIYAGASNGMTVGLQNLSNQNFYAVTSVVPPLSEQLEIVEYADGIEREYSFIIEKLTNEMALLGEFKSIVVADAVTGKIKI